MYDYISFVCDYNQKYKEYRGAILLRVLKDKCTILVLYQCKHFIAIDMLHKQYKSIMPLEDINISR